MFINNAPYKKPIHSDALGMQPDDVAEHRERFPDIEIDSENRPILTNMRQHDKYMEAIGVVKPEQKRRGIRRGTVIAAIDRWGNGVVIEGEEDADRTDATDIQEENTEETKDAG